MKTKQLLVALLVPFACACSNENLNEMVDNSNQSPILSRSVDNMPSFESEASFQQALKTIKSIESSEEKEAWVQENLGDFQSMQSVYDEASAEAENLGETKEEYMQFKNKYSTLYFPMYKEDYGYYIPFKDIAMASLVNANGDVCIAGNVVNKKDITSYNELMYLGRGYYESSIKPRATESFIFNDKVENVGSDWDSGWYEENKRKIKLKTRRRIENWKMVLHTEICFRKKTWLGWANYSSETTITGTARMYNNNGGLAQTINIYAYESGSSSHDRDHEPLNVYRSPKNTITNQYTYTVYKMIGEASVSFRGMGNARKYTWTLQPAENKNTASSVPIANLIIL